MKESLYRSRQGRERPPLLLLLLLCIVFLQDRKFPLEIY